MHHARTLLADTAENVIRTRLLPLRKYVWYPAI